MKQGILCPNVRDVFTSNGQGSIDFRDNRYSEIPQIIMRVYQNLDNIKSKLLEIDIDEFEEYWNCEIKAEDIFSKWVELIDINSKSIINNNLPLAEILLSTPQ